MSMVKYYVINKAKKVLVVIDRSKSVRSVYDIDMERYENTRNVIKDAEYCASILGYDIEYRYK